MSGSTQTLSRKIDGARDLQGVVRSMKALAASSIDQYEKAVEALEEYSRALQLGLSVCLRQSALRPRSVGTRSRGPRAIGAILFGSDQGLVGRFNEVLLDCAVSTLAALPVKVSRIWAVGERIGALIVEAGLPTPNPLSVPNSVDAITPLIGQILIELEAARVHGELLEVYLFHNHPGSAPLYEPVRQRLLPFDALWQRKFLELPWPTRNLPQVMEGTEPALQDLIREYLFVLLFQACAESLASENASRLASMQRAEKNIQDILEQLSRQFHRLRQESIDEELFEVISGYEALSRGVAHGGGRR
jgi:F-type H+-transporting ATPase subunit gamma